MESVKFLTSLHARALRVARTSSKKLRGATESRIEKWRAILARRRSAATFIAVTGSSAKSTTTALIAHILNGLGPAKMTVGNNIYRSHVSALRNLAPDVRFFVSEVAGHVPGALTPILHVLKPTVGIVTLVALEHKSAHRSIEGVAIEKGRLIEALPRDGLGILNYDDPHAASMAARGKARIVTFGKTGGDYVVGNARCKDLEDFRLTITYRGERFDIKTSFTGTHFSVPVAAAFACTHQLGVPPTIIAAQLANFKPLFSRLSVHRVENGPVLINDACKAPNHSVQLAFDTLAELAAPRKRIVLGAISDSSGSDRTYARAYQAARAVADQVIFIGEHSHRSKAGAEAIAAGRFVRFVSVKQAADYLKETAIPDELILVKGASNLHLERLVMNFFVPVRCWADACGKSAPCVPANGRGCGLYDTPFPEHKAARKRLVYPLPPDPHFD